MMMRAWGLIAACATVLGFVLPCATAAAAPLLLTHHGVLEQGGTPVNGQVLLTFKLYAANTDPTPFWEESLTLTATDGYYSAVLGLTALIEATDLTAASDPRLGITVNTGSELSPRLQVTSVPYALDAAFAAVAADVECTACVAASEVAFGYAGSASAGGPALNVDCSDACIGAAELENGAVITPKLADGAVTSAKIADGTITLADLGQNACATGQVIKWNGTAWACADSDQPGQIVMFAGACPPGWSEYTAMRGRVPRGEPSGNAGSLDLLGSDDAIVVAHAHTASETTAGDHTHAATTATAGSHSHGGATGSAAGHAHAGITANGGACGGMYQPPCVTPGNTGTANSHTHSISADGGHTHTVTVPNAGGHTHTITVNSSGASGAGANIQASAEVIFCVKN